MALKLSLNSVQKAFIDLGAESTQRSNEAGRTISIQVTCTRQCFEQQIDPQLLTWAIELGFDEEDDRPGYEIRGIEKVERSDKKSEETGGGTYRYTLVIYKF